MKTLDEAIELVKYREGAVDGRDRLRLAEFVSDERLLEIDIELDATDIKPRIILPWTEEEILKKLKRDAKFGLEKATDNRLVSAVCMLDCVDMWCEILENGLKSNNGKDYGQSFFEAILSHYKWS